MYLSTLNDVHLDRYIGAAPLERRTQATITDQAALRGEIESTRDRGYSEDAEEFVDGMIAIAMPVFDNRERLVSTVSFHAPTVRMSLERARKFVPRLRDTARELTKLVNA